MFESCLIIPVAKNFGMCYFSQLFDEHQGERILQLGEPKFLSSAGAGSQLAGSTFPFSFLESRQVGTDGHLGFTAHTLSTNI